MHIGNARETSTSLTLTLRDVQFSLGELNHVSFSSAQLYAVNATQAKFTITDFGSALIKDVELPFSHLDNVNFSDARLDNVRLESSNLKSVNFSFATAKDTDFSSAKLEKVYFFSTQLSNITFLANKLLDVDFSFAHMSSTDFSSRQLENISFTRARLRDVRFSSATLINVDFSSAALGNLECTPTLRFKIKIHFLIVFLVLANFKGAKMLQTNFVRAQRMLANFDDANLTSSDFRDANAKGATFTNADLTMVNFSGANLHMANLINTTITSDQLRSALSVRDARLPNGTKVRDPNFIKNGHAECTTTFPGQWNVLNGVINTTMSDLNSSDCRFALHSSTIRAAMSQRINLSAVWNSDLWPSSLALLSVRMSAGITVQLIGLNNMEQIVLKISASSSFT